MTENDLKASIAQGLKEGCATHLGPDQLTNTDTTKKNKGIGTVAELPGVKVGALNGDIEVVKIELTGDPAKTNRDLIVYYKKEGLGDQLNTLGGGVCSNTDQAGCFYHRCLIDYRGMFKPPPETPFTLKDADDQQCTLDTCHNISQEVLEEVDKKVVVKITSELKDKDCTQAGQYITGFDDSGNPLCAAPPAPTSVDVDAELKDKDCTQAGQYITGFDDNGRPVCAAVSSPQGNCEAGEFVREIRQDGTVICASACSGGRRLFERLRYLHPHNIIETKVFDVRNPFEIPEGYTFFDRRRYCDCPPGQTWENNHCVMPCTSPQKWVVSESACMSCPSSGGGEWSVNDYGQHQCDCPADKVKKKTGSSYSCENCPSDNPYIHTTVYGRSCLQCPANQWWDENKEECRSCHNGSITIDYLDNQKRKCKCPGQRLGEGFTQDGTCCRSSEHVSGGICCPVTKVGSNGFCCPITKPHRYDGACHLCPKGERVSLGICCPQNKVNSGGICCLPGQHGYKKSGQSKKACHPCPRGKRLSGGICCLPGWHGYRMGGALTKACHPCPRGQYYYDNGCHHCPRGKEQVGLLCLTPCRSPLVRQGTSCGCPSGLEKVGSRCLTPCQSPLVRQGTGCGCPSGTERVGSQCLTPCQAPRERQGTGCGCPSNKPHWHGGGCHFCPSGTFLAGSICVDPGIGPSSSSSSSSSGGGGNGGGNGGGDGGNGGGNGGGDGGGTPKSKRDQSNNRGALESYKEEAGIGGPPSGNDNDGGGNDNDGGGNDNDGGFGDWGGGW